jgi:hypothetical protein
MIGAGPFSSASSRDLPARDGHLTGDALREGDGIVVRRSACRAGQGRAEAEEAHAVAALVGDLVALLSSGRPLISTTLSSMRVNTATTSR